MKNSKTLGIVLGAAALLVLAGIAAMGIFYQSTSANAASYYGRINNEQVEEITPHGGMNYRYHLLVYDDSGKAHDLDLDTSRILKDSAFILIKTAPLRGVLSWEELQYEQLPEVVQTKYTAP